ncbi:hypothetical protein D9613_003688 [Agrocybe pediades]|uniref:F-box domain-containing protein n=1 Tax=Agrocybe pediades TaxID=84607 RepID=A0A8H4VJ37_9AGAR|nr:hypothetical protein D9613_003688 [Agrocybe pediades]
MGQILSIRNAPWAIRAPYLATYDFIYHRTKATYALLHGNAHRQQPRTLDSLPNELLLHIFSFLELKSYLISRAVCKKWQMLLPHAEVHPIRRRMLKLFEHMLQAPKFLETRPWILDNLRHFDRQAYIEGLLDQYPAIPEEYRLWILEWPEKMVVYALWPGLPLVLFNKDTIQMGQGVNWMAYPSPLLLTLAYNKGSLDTKENLTPALLAWRTSERTHWLLFDKDEPDLFGRVLIITYPELPVLYPTLEMYDRDDVPFYVEDFPDWITYLEHRWDRGLSNRPPTRNPFTEPIVPVDFPVQYQFSALVAKVLPSPPWVDRQAPTFLADIKNLLS